MTPTVVPTLDDLARDPTRARDLSPEVARDLLACLAGLQTVLLAQALQLPGGHNGPGEAPGEDRLLDVAEVAARLGRSRDYVYRRDWPFEVKGLGRGRRFSAQGLDRYLRQRQGR